MKRRGSWTVEYKDEKGESQRIEAEHIISSAPMRELICGLSPSVSERTKHAAESLKYRDFLTVMLILKDRQMFDDNWIYIHDPSVKVGRVQNFRSWSPEMVPEPDKVCYGLEYFCFEHDGLWDSSDNDLIELARRELVQIGLAREGDFVDGCVVRQKKAYPVYDDDYARHVVNGICLFLAHDAPIYKVPPWPSQSEQAPAWRARLNRYRSNPRVRVRNEKYSSVDGPLSGSARLATTNRSFERDRLDAWISECKSSCHQITADLSRSTSR